MPLTIKIVSEHRDLVGDDYVREYYEQGGTIGRSEGRHSVEGEAER